MKLYLGCGQKYLSGYVHSDIVPGPNVDVVWDLNKVPWPWEANSASIIVAEDLIEHLDINLISFCDEAWRVLSAEGQIYIRTPDYRGESSWIDPTHRWHLHEWSFHYLDPDTEWGRTYPHYTPKKWTIISIGIRGPQNIHVVMEPRK